MRTPTFGILLDQLESASREADPSSRTAALLLEVIGDVRSSADLPRKPDGQNEPDTSGVLRESVPEAVFDDVTARIESAGIRLTF